jgi:hypothetical protein
LQQGFQAWCSHAVSNDVVVIAFLVLDVKTLQVNRLVETSGNTHVREQKKNRRGIAPAAVLDQAFPITSSDT